MSEKHERGPTTGTHKGYDIPAWIDEDDGRYLFNRIAVECPKGGVWLSQLRKDEFVICPGLIYRKAAPDA